MSRHITVAYLSVECTGRAVVCAGVKLEKYWFIDRQMSTKYQYQFENKHIGRSLTKTMLYSSQEVGRHHFRFPLVFFGDSEYQDLSIFEQKVFHCISMAICSLSNKGGTMHL